MEYLKMVWEGGWPFWLVNGVLAWIVLGIVKAVFLDLPRHILSPSYEHRRRLQNNLHYRVVRSVEDPSVSRNVFTSGEE